MISAGRQLETVGIYSVPNGEVEIYRDNGVFGGSLSLGKLNRGEIKNTTTKNIGLSV